MSISINKATVLGNLGKDPEVRQTSAGSKVATFSVATSESWKDKSTGQKKEKTEWHNIVIFNENLVNLVENYLNKGSKVYIEGQIQTREYTDRDNNQKRITEVVLQRYRGELILLDSRKTSTFENKDKFNENSNISEKTSKEESLNDDLNDEIPF